MNSTIKNIFLYAAQAASGIISYKVFISFLGEGDFGYFIAITSSLVWFNLFSVFTTGGFSVKISELLSFNKDVNDLFGTTIRNSFIIALIVAVGVFLYLFFIY